MQRFKIFTIIGIIAFALITAFSTTAQMVYTLGEDLTVYAHHSMNSELVEKVPAGTELYIITGVETSTPQQSWVQLEVEGYYFDIYALEREFYDAIDQSTRPQVQEGVITVFGDPNENTNEDGSLNITILNEGSFTPATVPYGSLTGLWNDNQRDTDLYLCLNLDGCEYETRGDYRTYQYTSGEAIDAETFSTWICTQMRSFPYAQRIITVSQQLSVVLCRQ